MLSTEESVASIHIATVAVAVISISVREVRVLKGIGTVAYCSLVGASIVIVSVAPGDVVGFFVPGNIILKATVGPLCGVFTLARGVNVVILAVAAVAHVVAVAIIAVPHVVAVAIIAVAAVVHVEAVAIKAKAILVVAIVARVIAVISRYLR